MIRRESAAEGAVAVLILDRPERRNALDSAHWADLASAVTDASRGEARAIVLTGEGSCFCAGGDLDDPDTEGLAILLERCFTAIREVPIPVVAYINGPAVGGGAQLAVSCDLRVASPTARFGIPAAAISLPANPGTIARLVALAGSGAARAMLIGGDSITAERAFTLGLVERLGEFDDALAWAGEIAQSAPLLLEFFKNQLQVGNPTDDGMYSSFLSSVLQSEDRAESIRARAEKRKPQYVGR